MKFPFMVKLNGINYEAYEEVPVGEVKEEEKPVEEKTATELRNQLLEEFGIDLPVQKGKENLLKALEEARAGQTVDVEEEPEEEPKESEEETFEDVSNLLAD